MPLPLTLVALASLALSGAIAAWIAVDELQRPQPMRIMNAVWPLSALFGSVLVLWFYLRHGRAPETAGEHRHRHHHDGEATAFPVAVSKGVLHCGSGCTLGDIVAETALVAFPGLAAAFGLGTLFADRMFAAWVADFILAFGFGIAFQYFALRPMREGSRLGILLDALKADALSLTAWQVGMYGFMALVNLWAFPALFGMRAEPSSPVFWFAMQFAMGFGFITAWPVNWWLIRSGIKEAM